MYFHHDVSYVKEGYAKKHRMAWHSNKMNIEQGSAKKNERNIQHATPQQNILIILLEYFSFQFLPDLVFRVKISRDNYPESK